MILTTDPPFNDWLRALEARHSADLSFQEIRRGIQALSWRYVERRAERGLGATLDGRGKRAAFALFYAPLHLITVHRIVCELQPEEEAPASLLDLGCGTGAGAAGWALALPVRPSVRGVDLHPWAVGECRWNWQALGLGGEARRGDLRRHDPGRLDRTGVVVAYTFNELPDDVRDRWLQRLIEGPRRPRRLLVVEPISRRVSPWWDRWAAAAEAAGGRADCWEFREELPAPLSALDRAAGLRHGVLKARSLWV